MTGSRWRRLFHSADRVPGIRKVWDTTWIATLNETYRDRQELQATLDPAPEAGPRPLAIKIVASRLSRTEPEAAWLLGSSLAASAKRIATGGLSRHLFDALLVAGIAVLALLPLLSARHNARADDAAKAAAIAAQARPRLEAVHDLAAYVPLQAADVVPRATATPQDAAALVASAVGRYPRSAIEKGKPIDPARLSKRRTALTRFSVLRVALKVQPAFDASSFPIAVHLVLSARGAPPAGAVLDSELLDLASDGISATVGVPEAQLPEAARLLGGADAYVALPVP